MKIQKNMMVLLVLSLLSLNTAFAAHKKAALEEFPKALTAPKAQLSHTPPSEVTSHTIFNLFKDHLPHSTLVKNIRQDTQKDILDGFIEKKLFEYERKEIVEKLLDNKSDLRKRIKQGFLVVNELQSKEKKFEILKQYSWTQKYTVESMIWLFIASCIANKDQGCRYNPQNKSIILTLNTQQGAALQTLINTINPATTPEEKISESYSYFGLGKEHYYDFGSNTKLPFGYRYIVPLNPEWTQIELR